MDAFRRTGRTFPSRNKKKGTDIVNLDQLDKIEDNDYEETVDCLENYLNRYYEKHLKWPKTRHKKLFRILLRDQYG